MIVEKNGYREKYLGREAVFLIPTSKLNIKIGQGTSAETVVEMIRIFLKKYYGNAWQEYENIRGTWGGIPDGLYVKFQISFVGKNRIPRLKRFLGKIARDIEEECIYLGTGEDFYAIYPLA